MPLFIHHIISTDEEFLQAVFALPAFPFSFDFIHRLNEVHLYELPCRRLAHIALLVKETKLISVPRLEGCQIPLFALSEIGTLFFSLSHHAQR